MLHYWYRTEYWEESWRLVETCYHSNFSGWPSANAGVKNSEEVNNNNRDNKNDNGTCFRIIKEPENTWLAHRISNTPSTNKKRHKIKKKKKRKRKNKKLSRNHIPSPENKMITSILKERIVKSIVSNTIFPKKKKLPKTIIWLQRSAVHKQDQDCRSKQKTPKYSFD